MLEINNLTTVSIDEGFFKRIAEMVLKEEKREGNTSLVIVGEGRIKELNYKHRGKNRITDVLSFGKDSEGKFIDNQLGEIFLCLKAIKKISKRENLSFDKELARAFIHGLLHIIGYDHQEEIEKEKMIFLEDKYINIFFKEHV